MVSLLDFANRIRTLQELEEERVVWVRGTEPDDERNCVVARALGVPIGESAHHEWAREGRWVMRFADRLAARRVGTVTGLAWLPEPAEVALPDVLVDLVVAHHYDACRGDDLGILRVWVVPDGDTGSCSWLTPTDDLILGDCGVVRPVAV